MSVTVRPRAVDRTASGSRRVEIRRDAVVFALSSLAAAAVVAHGFVTTATSSVADATHVVPAVVYVVLGLLGFFRRTRMAASWLMMVWAWVMVTIALVSLLPTTGSPYEPTTVTHGLLHAAFVGCQIPLVVVLVRRLNNDSPRITAR